MEKTYSEKYAEQDRICIENKAIIEFFLKNFREKHPELELGTRFYTDVTVLSGPSTAQHEYIAQEHKDLDQRWKNGEVAIHNVKWAGVSFVTEYKKTYLDDGKVYVYPKEIPVDAFMICEGKEYPVPVDIANAISRLYKAQEYRSAIYAAQMAKMVHAM